MVEMDQYATTTKTVSVCCCIIQGSQASDDIAAANGVSATNFAFINIAERKFGLKFS